MKTYHYVAFRKKPGLREFYVGDGTWEAKNKATARKEIAEARKVPASRLRLTLVLKVKLPETK